MCLHDCEIFVNLPLSFEALVSSAVSGVQGIMVAGGSSSSSPHLASAEFLDLGPSLAALLPRDQLRWRRLPGMKQNKSSSLLLVNSK